MVNADCGTERKTSILVNRVQAKDLDKMTTKTLVLEQKSLCLSKHPIPENSLHLCPLACMLERRSTVLYYIITEKHHRPQIKQI